MTADHHLHVDNRGRTATVDRAGYLRDLVEQVLFTAPGERVMRPDFGAGVSQLLFEPGGMEVAATAKLLIQSSLQQWLGDVIDVLQVDVVSEESTLAILVAFTERRTGLTLNERFELEGGGAQ
jgi:phage baseplate assembly protein W